MNFGVELLVLGVLMFALMLGAIEMGRRIGLRRISREGDEARRGTGVVENAVFGLFALLMAFAFNSAAGRYDARRLLNINEANAIGTAWLRLDLLAEEARSPIKQNLLEYLEIRIEVPAHRSDSSRLQSDLNRLTTLRDQIWSRATAACSKDPRPMLMGMVLPALNQMFDLGASQLATSYMHIPKIIMVMLFVLAVISGILAGHAMAAKHHNWLHVLVFSSLIAVTVMITLDLEYPRMGFIRLDAADQPLRDLLLELKGSAPSPVG